MLSIHELKGFSLFKNLANRYLEELLIDGVVERFSTGQGIFDKNQAAHKQYFLLDGYVNLIDTQYGVMTIKAKSRDASKALNACSAILQSVVAESSNVRVFSIDTAILERITLRSRLSANAEIEQANIDTGFHRALLHVEQADDWMSHLLESPLFSRIPLNQVQELFKRFDDRIRERGEVVMREGERGDFFYVIASGAVTVTNRIGTINLALGPGQYFGEEALLGSTLRNATVTMTQDGCLKRLSASDFMDLVKNPVVSYIEPDVLDSLDKPYTLLDVKIPLEYRDDHLPGCINIPLARLRSRISTLPRNSIYVVPDDGFGRADIAVYLLCQAGLDAVVLKNAFQLAAE